MGFTKISQIIGFIGYKRVTFLIYKLCVCKMPLTESIILFSWVKKKMIDAITCVGTKKTTLKRNSQEIYQALP